jgi:hypothetical protein
VTGTALLLSLHLAVAPAAAGSGAVVCEAMPAPSAATVVALARADSALEALYNQGVPFSEFLENARARRDQWKRNYADARVPDDALGLAIATPGRWRLLVIAVDGCSDSVNTIPILAMLDSLVSTIDLRIITPDVGRGLQEARRTPDGRAATPTVILIDEHGADAGCFIERPSELVRKGAEARASGTYDVFLTGKQAWYTADAGHSTVREVVALMVAAAEGRPQCGTPAPSGTP